MEVLPFAAAVHFAPYPNQAEEWTAHPSVAGSNPAGSTSFAPFEVSNSRFQGSRFQTCKYTIWDVQ